MNIFDTIRWLLAPCMPMYLGGKGGSSQANTNTSTSTTTSSVNTDNSMMGGDDAVMTHGNGNTIDKSIVNNTAFNDSSDHSTNFTDNSTDSSNHSTNYSTTDFGAVTAALNGMGQLSSQALTTSGQMVKDGFGAVSSQSKDNLSVLQQAFQFASAATAADVSKYTDVLGFAKDAISKSNDAYADAKDGGTNKTLTIAAVAVIGVVGLAAAFGRI